MKPGVYNIPPHVKGDTWIFNNPIQFLFSPDNPINLENSRVDMWIRSKSAKGRVFLKLSTENNAITITDPQQGQIAINPMLVNRPAGEYYYDIQLILNQQKFTYLVGHWHIIEDATDI